MQKPMRVCVLTGPQSRDHRGDNCAENSFGAPFRCAYADDTDNGHPQNANNQPPTAALT